MKKLFPLVFFLLSLCNTAFCGTSDSSYYLNPEKIIAESIFTHKITMLGEGITHNNPITYFNLINILNNWLLKVQGDDKLSSNLTLVVECDSSTAAYMDYYIRNGDIHPFMDFAAPSILMEDLELLYELRKFYISVEKQSSQTRKINFSIKGFEQIGYNIDADYFNLNQTDQELWFINKRDEYTSRGIINYIKENPEYRLLIYYGGAHLQTGMMSKKLYVYSLPEDKCQGKWIAQYLLDEYGQNNIDSYFSVAFRKFMLETGKYKGLAGKTFLIINPDSSYKLNLPGISKFLVNTYEELPSHTVNFSLSRYITEKSIERISRFEKYTGYKAGSGMMPLFYLKLLHDITFRKSADIQKWYESNNYPGTDLLDTKEFQDKMMAYYFEDPDNYSRVSMLFRLGFSPRLYALKPDKTEWETNIWPESLKDIKFINNVGIYWVGYADEKEKAKQFLKEFSGKDFTEPAKYLQWWRREYKGYSI